MRIYNGKRPPGWSKVPDSPVILLTVAETTAAADSLSDIWRDIREKAERVFAREAFARRVYVCDSTGAILRTIER